MVGMCWITLQENKTTGSIWQVFQFYLPLWCAFVFNCYIYYVVVKAVKIIMTDIDTGNREEIENRVKYVMRLRFYPLILVIC